MKKEKNLGKLVYVSRNISVVERLIKKKKKKIPIIFNYLERAKGGKDGGKLSWKRTGEKFFARSVHPKIASRRLYHGDAIRPSNFPARLRRNSAVSDFFRRRRASPSRVIAFPRNRWTPRVIAGDFIRQSARGKRPIQPTSLGKLSQLFDESRYSSLVDVPWKSRFR